MVNVLIVEWKNPRRLSQGTITVKEIAWVPWAVDQYPSKGDTFVSGGMSYTVLSREINLDTGVTNIRAMLTKDINGSDEEDL